MSGPFGSSQWMYNPGGGFYDYEIDNSLRFNDNASAYLNRTPASTGNRKTWTYSCWFKRGNLGIDVNFFNPHNGGNESQLKIRSDNKIQLYDSGGLPLNNVTDAVFRDTSAWYHLVVRVDTTQATGSDRVRIYINNELQSVTNAGYGTTTPSQNYDTEWNLNCLHTIGKTAYASSGYFDGYMAEINHVDGQSLAPTEFGEEKSGIWIPKAYSGSYGTNGFHLEFAGNANDTSGNGNNWTTNNIGSHDYMLDSPTNNFCVMNSLHNMWYKNMSQGGLRVQAIGSVTAPYASTYVGTIGVRTGKWYWEYRLNTHNNGNTAGFIRNGNLATDGSYPRDNSVDRIFGINNWDNAIYVGASAISKSFNVNGTAGDIMSITYDADNNTFSLYKNGSFVGTSATNSLSLGPGEHALPMMSVAFWDNQMHLNFGQDSTFAGATTAGGNADENGYGDFKYAPPSGYLAICTANLPAPAIDPATDDTPEDNFNTVLYTGTGSTRSITGVGFQPDWVWLKRRSASANPTLVDAVRGVTKTLETTTTGTEETQTQSITSFDSDGWTIGSRLQDNGSGFTYVAWNWKAGGTGASNTNGSITSTVSANPDAGFSIVSYTGTQAAATVGHGLSNAPTFIITKCRSASNGWPCYHTDIPSANQYIIRLNEDTSYTHGGQSSIWWNNTHPSSTVFSLGANDESNKSGQTHIAYCFHSVEGYSKIGSYVPNQSTDGAFIYLGFRPAFFLAKNISRTQEWAIHDNKRTIAYNPANGSIYPNLSNAEYTGNEMDFMSNGVKLRNSGGSFNYASGDTIIYLAFAEQPFKYANAR